MNIAKVKVLLVCLLAWLSLTASAQNTPSFVPLPKTDETIKLRVLILNNERLALLSVAAALKILDQTRALTSLHFGVKVVFETPKIGSLLQVKPLMSAADLQAIKSFSLDINLPEDVSQLRKSISTDLSLEGGVTQGVRSYAEKYLSEKPADSSAQAFTDALANTQIKLLREWKEQRLSDGKLLIAEDQFNEYFFWQILGYKKIPYEVILTNQLIVSAEKSANSVHSALRGGVTNGVTNSSRSSQNGALSVVSTFPFFSKDRLTARLRGDKDYTDDEAINYVAALLTHELGHQLLHLGHPFDNAACIMRPPQRLEFDNWYKLLNADKCKLNSSDAMTPGKTVKHSDIREK